MHNSEEMNRVLKMAQWWMASAGAKNPRFKSMPSIGCVYAIAENKPLMRFSSDFPNAFINREILTGPNAGLGRSELRK